MLLFFLFSCHRLGKPFAPVNVIAITQPLAGRSQSLLLSFDKISRCFHTILLSSDFFNLVFLKSLRNSLRNVLLALSRVQIGADPTIERNPEPSDA